MMNKKLKQISLCIMAFLITIIPVSSWSDNTQIKTNEFKSVLETNDVVLTKRGIDRDQNIVNPGLQGAVFDLYSVTARGETKIESDLVTDSNGEIWNRNLGVGSYYFEEVNVPPGYDYQRDGTGKEIRKHYFSVKAANENDNIVYVDVDNLKKESSLTLNKTIVSDTSLTQEQQDMVFSFKVEFLDMKPNAIIPYTIEGLDPLTVVNGGEIKLKHGDSATFTNLDYGTRYQITETDSKGYHISSHNNSGILNEKNLVNFYNIENIGEFGQVTVKKNVKNEDGSSLTDAQKNKQFEFKVSFEDETEHDVLFSDGTTKTLENGKTVLLSHEESFSILGLKRGTSFKIEELLNDSDYSTAMRVIEGTVSKYGEVQSYIVENIKKSNTSSLKTSNLEVSKFVVGANVAALKEDLFTFKIDFEGIKETVDYSINNGENFKFKSGDQIQLKADDVITFKKLPIGTNYKVEELENKYYQSLVKGVEGSITSALNRIVFVNESLSLDRDVTISKSVENIKTDQAFKFHLIYGKQSIPFTLKDGESQTFSLPIGTVFKVVEDDYRNQGFVLTIENGQATVGSSGVLVNAKNVYHQELVSDKIEGTVRWIVDDAYRNEIPKFVTLDIYDDAGKIVKSIEVSGTDKLWNYTVELPRYNAQGNRVKYTVVQNSLENFKTTYQGLHVTNQYLRKISYLPKITKTVTGNILPGMNAMFEFRINAMDGAPLQRDNAVFINGEGQANFLAIDFDKEGVYNYTIQEVTGRDKNIDYDKLSIQLKIEVIDQRGVLVIKKATYLREGIEVDSAQFVNKIVDDSGTKPPTEGPDGSGENPDQKPPKPTEPSKPSKPGKPEVLPHTGVKPALIGKIGMAMMALGFVVSCICNLNRIKEKRKRR